MLKHLASFSAFPAARLFPFFHFVSGSLLPFPSISSHLELPLPSIYCFCLHAMIFVPSKIYTQVWSHRKIMGLMSEWSTTVETGSLGMGLEGQPSKDSSGCCATDTSSLRNWAWAVGGQDTQNWFCLLITTTKGFEQTLVVHLIVWKLKTPPAWRWTVNRYLEANSHFLGCFQILICAGSLCSVLRWSHAVLTSGFVFRD